MKELVRLIEQRLLGRGRQIASAVALCAITAVMAPACEEASDHAAADAGNDGTAAVAPESPETDAVYPWEKYHTSVSIPDELIERVASGKTIDIVIVVDDSEVDAELFRKTGTPDRSRDSTELRLERAEKQQAIVDETLADIPESGARVRQRYGHLPIATLELSELEALELMAAHPKMVRIESEQEVRTSTTQSLPLISQPTAAANGLLGAGTTVAVLDTGVDYLQSAFGCTGLAAPSTCKVVVAQDFATNDNLRDDSGQHGTNVAGIVSAVAPGAKIAALDVFSGSSASSIDIIEAIDWVVANKATYNIVAMNLSLGGGRYTSACPSDAMASALATARSAGVLSAVATGNDAYKNSVASPACGPAVISVGAVYDSNVGGMAWSSCTDTTTSADFVTCFSNSATFMTMLAPGAMITAAGTTKGGTSMASPHVAGAIAVLTAAFPTETVDEIVTRLTNGPLVTDTRNGISKPRLALPTTPPACNATLNKGSISASAASATGTITVSTGSGCPWTATSSDSWITITSGASGSGNGTVGYSIAANTGASRAGSLTVAGRIVTVTQEGSTALPTVTINGGAALAKSATVTLAIAGNSQAWPSMCISNTTTCATFATFASTKTWKLTTGNGVKTVYAYFKNSAGTVSEAVVTGIALDATAPTNGTLTAAQGIQKATFSWTGFSDTDSGIAAYVLVFSATASPKSCADTAATKLYEGTNTSYQHTGLTNGTKYYYRLCATDNAGNTSVGLTATVTPVPEITPPMGTLTIQGGDVVGKTSVTLALSASDANSVTYMCISNTTTCAKWVAYATSLSWKLSTGDGPKTVYASFQDGYGNKSEPVTDTVILDAAAPKDGTVTAATGNGQLALSWTGYTDAASGIASYRVVFQAGTTAPSSCASGTLVYQGANTSYVHTGLTNGSKYSYRVCATDAAGLSSKGATATGGPAPETTPPTGTVAIQGGATLTASPKVTLVFEATDNTGVAKVCVSNTTTCSSWKAYASTMSWTLSTGNGAKTIYAWFEDTWGNRTTVPAQVSISLDGTKPVNGTVSASAGSKQVALTWTGFSDANSGIASYKVVYAVGSTAPSSCLSGTVVYTGTATTTTHTGLTGGTAVSYRVCAIDQAGNLSTGATAVATPAQ